MGKSGQMRVRVRIEEQTSTQDASGQPLDTWTEFATRWAKLRRAPGREIFASAQREGRVPVVFELRYVAGVKPGMRLVFGGKVHDIISAVDPDQRRMDLVITAEEHVEAAG